MRDKSGVCILAECLPLALLALMSLSTLLSAFEEHREHLAQLSMAQLEVFTALARHLKPRIALQCRTPAVPPPALPLSIHQFICAATGAPDASIKLCWDVLKSHVWSLPACEANPSVFRSVFEEHGYPLGIGVCVIVENETFLTLRQAFAT